jgi:mevalonate pyrophosphate decarboxylase
MVVKKEAWSELTPEQRAESLYKDIKEAFLTEDIKGFIYIAQTDSGHMIASWGENNIYGAAGALLQHLKYARKLQAHTPTAAMK